MRTYRVLGQKGRTTIPLSIRMRLGLRCGDVLSFEEENGAVTVRKEKLCDHCKDRLESQGASLSALADSLSQDERRVLLTCLIAKFSEELGDVHAH